MLNSHRKTIGVFINRSESEFQQVTIQGLVSEAQQYGFNVAFGILMEFEKVRICMIIMKVRLLILHQ